MDSSYLWHQQKQAQDNVHDGLGASSSVSSSSLRNGVEQNGQGGVQSGQWEHGYDYGNGQFQRFICLRDYERSFLPFCIFVQVLPVRMVPKACSNRYPRRTTIPAGISMTIFRSYLVPCNHRVVSKPSVQQPS
jgi:hypothetical protein